MSSQAFCPLCGAQRVGRACGSCGYDFVEGAKTPTITLSRGINYVSLVVGVVAIVFIAVIVYLLTFV